MHGWISLPGSWQLSLLVLAVVLGAVLGRARAGRNGIALWLAFSFVYAGFAMAVAFGYESLRFPGDYNLAAWMLLLLPALAATLPAIGLPWALANSLARNPAAAASDYRVRLLIVFALAVVLGAIALVGWQPSVRQRWMHFVTAPRDLTSVTNGSDWTCVNSSPYGPALAGVLDLHFSAGVQRWQTFLHEETERPFFDLDHAVGKDLFSAGSYRVERGKLELTYDVWGNPRAGGDSAATDAPALNVRDNSRLRGAIMLEKVSERVDETLSLHSLTAEAMELVAQYGNASNYAVALTCRRIRADTFREVPLLDRDSPGAAAGQPSER